MSLTIDDLANGVDGFANFGSEGGNRLLAGLEVIDQLHGANMPKLGTLSKRKMCPVCHLGCRVHCGHNDGMLGNNIAQIRKAAGMSQTALAEAIGTTLNNLGKLERGDRRLNQDWINKIAVALGVEPGAVIGQQADVLAEGAEPAVAIPILGEVPAGPWREEVRSPRGWEHVARSEVTRNSYALKVSGDSMDRIVKDRATIIVDPDDRDLFHQRLFVVRGPDGVTFKQYLDGPARLVPCSTNPEHQTISAHDKAFDVIGRVKKVILDPSQAALE